MGSALEFTASRLSLKPSLRCIRHGVYSGCMTPAWHLQSRTLAMRGLWACACDLCLGMYAPCAWRVARESLGIHPRYLWPADAVRLAGEAGGGQRWRQVGEGVRWRASRGKPFTVRIAMREAPAVGTAPSGHHFPHVSRVGASTDRRDPQRRHSGLKFGEARA